MSVSWKDIDRYTQAVFVDEEYIGEIRAEFLTMKWKMYPSFWDENTNQSSFYKIYHSAYECGKAMAELYKTTLLTEDETWDDPWGYVDKDTDEIDMRGYFGNRKP